MDVVAPKAIPQEIEHEDTTLTAIPLKAKEVLALTTTPPGVTEAAPTTTSLQRAEEDPTLTAVPVVRPVLTPLPQEVNDAAHAPIPLGATDEDATLKALQQEAAKEARASISDP